MIAMAAFLLPSSATAGPMRQLMSKLPEVAPVSVSPVPGSDVTCGRTFGGPWPDGSTSSFTGCTARVPVPAAVQPYVFGMTEVSVGAGCGSGEGGGGNPDYYDGHCGSIPIDYHEYNNEFQGEGSRLDVAGVGITCRGLSIDPVGVDSCSP
jgi:hypothetical protein